MAATRPGPSSSATLPACAAANASARSWADGEHRVDGGARGRPPSVEQRVEVPGDGFELGIGGGVGRAHAPRVRSAVQVGSGPLAAPARRPSSTIARWRRQASRRSGAPSSWRCRCRTSASGCRRRSCPRAARRPPGARAISSPSSRSAPRPSASRDSIAPGMLANTSLSARSAAIVSAPRHSSVAERLPRVLDRERRLGRLGDRLEGRRPSAPRSAPPWWGSGGRRCPRRRRRAAPRRPSARRGRARRRPRAPPSGPSRGCGGRRRGAAARRGRRVVTCQ